VEHGQLRVPYMLLTTCEIQGAVSLSRLGCGTSYFSSAIIGNFRSSLPELAVVSESARLYKELHNSGHDIGNCY